MRFYVYADERMYDIVDVDSSGDKAKKAEEIKTEYESKEIGKIEVIYVCD